MPMSILYCVKHFIDNTPTIFFTKITSIDNKSRRNEFIEIFLRFMFRHLFSTATAYRVILYFVFHIQETIFFENLYILFLPKINIHSITIHSNLSTRSFSFANILEDTIINKVRNRGIF